MNRDIDRYLEEYSKIDFRGDLNNLERDVINRICNTRTAPGKFKILFETWFGMPISMSASLVASTLILSVFLGAQMQTGSLQDEHDALGFDVFTASSTKLPSSLLVPKA